MADINGGDCDAGVFIKCDVTGCDVPALNQRCEWRWWVLNVIAGGDCDAGVLIRFDITVTVRGVRRWVRVVIGAGDCDCGVFMPLTIIPILPGFLIVSLTIFVPGTSRTVSPGRTLNTRSRSS